MSKQIEPPKLHCPFCKGELKGNTHKNDIYAWAAFNCEYDRSRQDEKPVDEIEIRSEQLREENEIRLGAIKRAKRLKARILELNNFTGA